MNNPEISGDNGYPDPETIELESNEVVGTLARVGDTEEGRLVIRNPRSGDGKRLRSLFLTEAATRDIETIFGDVKSRIGKTIVVRTDQGAKFGGIYEATEVLGPNELID
jgi:hypothetical protein